LGERGKKALPEPLRKRGGREKNQKKKGGEGGEEKGKKLG